MAVTLELGCQDNAASTTVVAGVGSNATLQGGDNTSAKTTNGPSGPLGAGNWPLAFQLNGTDDYIQSGATFDSDAAFSISGWVYLPSSSTGDKCFAGALNTFDNVMIYYASNNTWRFFMGGSTDGTNAFSPVPSSTMTRDVWHHVAATCSGAGASSVLGFWLDGVLLGTKTLSAANTSAHTLAFSRRAGGTLFWPGKLAGLRLHNAALDEAAVLADMGDAEPYRIINTSPPYAFRFEKRRLIVPGGLGFTPDFQIEDETGRTSYRWHNHITATAKYVDAIAGNDTTGDGSEGTPWKTLKKAWDTAGAKTVYGKGDFYQEEAVPLNGRFAENGGGDQALIGWNGPCRLIGGVKPSSLTWSAQGNGVYTATLPQAACHHVVDDVNLDSYGNPSPLTEQASSAAVEASGGWFRSSTTLYVKLASSGDPTSVVIVMYAKTGQTAPVNFYAWDSYWDNVRWLGWSMTLNPEANSVAGYHKFIDCRFGYASANNFATTLETIDHGYALRCHSCYSVNGDGLNGTSAANGQWLEESCISYMNGGDAFLGSAHQNSTMHNSIRCVRTDGTYERAAGQNIADVGTGKVWNVLSLVRSSRDNTGARDDDVATFDTVASYSYGLDLSGSTSAGSFAGGNTDDCVFSGTDSSTPYTQTFENETEFGEAILSEAASWSEGTITYRWERADDDSGTNAAAIGGATSAVYELTEDDLGKWLRIVEIATNDGDEQESESDWIEIEQAGGIPSGSLTSALRSALRPALISSREREEY
jgi:hypothetical protein